MRVVLLIVAGMVVLTGVSWVVNTWGGEPGEPPRARVDDAVAVRAQGGVTVRSVVTPTVASERGQRTPAAPPVVALAVHVDAEVTGAGSVHAVAASLGGQASAHIDSEGEASGHAMANAPNCGGVCAGGAGLDLTPFPAGSVGARPQDARGAQLVVTGDWVNARRGPGLTAGIVASVRQGELYTITGRSADWAWWRVCCVSGQAVWLNAQFVQATNTEAVPVIETSASSGEPLETVVAPSSPFSLLLGGGTPPSLPPDLPQEGGTLPFTIVAQEQHREANAATLYVLVVDQSGQALGNYGLRVTKNGVAVPGDVVRTTPYLQGTTRPSQPGGAEDKPYNAKLAFDPHVVGASWEPTGAWVVALLDGQGQVIAPAALFRLQPGDRQMEMYVAFGRK